MSQIICIEAAFLLSSTASTYVKHEVTALFTIF